MDGCSSWRKLLSEPIAFSKSRAKLSVQRARGPALVGSPKDISRDVSADRIYSELNELRLLVAEAKNGKKVCDGSLSSFEIARKVDEADKGGVSVLCESAVEAKSEAEKAQSESHRCDSICDRSGAEETPPPFLVEHTNAK